MPKENAKPCFICNAPSDHVPWPGDRAAFQVKCARCGEYHIPRTVTVELSLDDTQRGALSGYLKHRTVRGEPPPIITTNRAEAFPGAITIDDALASRPRRAGDVQDAVLVAIARMIGTPGGKVRLTDDDAALAYSLQPFDFRWHRDQLLARNLLRYAEGNDIYNLSHAAWQLVDDLDRGRVEVPDQAFVAMWFDASMDDAYERGIKPAIEAAGYRPYRIKEVEHNNKICDEILAEIRRSRFVVAEFTGNRGGVYFEAGFAMGLERPVVWIVRAEDLEKGHFDTEHFNHITWTTVEDLKTKLQRRIEATIPRLRKA